MSDLILERRKSSKAFIGPYILAVLGGIVLAVIAFMIPHGGAFSPIGILPLLVVLAWSYLARISEVYRLYMDRLEIESGILARKIENVELFRIRDVGMRQGLLGRMGNFGDVYVHSTDSTTPLMHIRGIDMPQELYQQLRQRVTESRAHTRTMIVEQGREVAEP